MAATDSATRAWQMSSADSRLAQYLDGNLVRLDRGRNAAIERNQEQDLADLLRAAAVLEGALEMDAQLGRLAELLEQEDLRIFVAFVGRSLAAARFAPRTQSSDGSARFE